MEEAAFDYNKTRGSSRPELDTPKRNETLSDFWEESDTSSTLSSPRDPENPRLVVCSFVYREASTQIVEQAHLGFIEAFFVRMKSLGLHAVVALAAQDQPLLAALKDLVSANHFMVSFVPVGRWNQTTSVMNTLVSEAVRKGADLVLFQSMEVIFSQALLDALINQMDPHTLVVGAEIPGMHSFSAETDKNNNRLSAKTSPWNTFSLWNPEKLCLTGFLPISDGVVNGVPCGVEEVAAIALLQKLLSPSAAIAKLVRFPGLALLPWQHAAPGCDPRLKMTLDLNSLNQLSALGGLVGTVTHLDLTPQVSLSLVTPSLPQEDNLDLPEESSACISAADTLQGGEEFQIQLRNATREAYWIETHANNKEVMASYASNGVISAADYFESVCDQRPDTVFVESVESGRLYTYRETDDLANSVAHWVISRGFGVGDAIALAMENCPRFIQVWLGLAKAGVTIACINTNITGDNLTHAVHVANCRAAIVSSRQEAKWAEIGGATALGIPMYISSGSLHDREQKNGQLEEECSVSSRPDRSVRSNVKGLDALFYIYTSGTTGRSKAAIFSHTRFIGAGVTWARAMSLTPQDIYYVTLPLYHGNGGCVAVSAALRSGARLVLREKFSVSNFLPDIRKHNCTATIYIGEMWRYLHNTPGKPDDAENPLRVACGNGLRSDIWRPVCDRFGIDLIVEHYGQTEMPSAHPMINNFNVVGSCGYIPPSIRGSLLTECLIRFDIELNEPVRDDNGFCVRCRPGEEGESIVCLNTQYRGYTSEEAAKRAVYTNVFENGDMWYHSGDLLRYDADGFFYFVDRVGDTFRWKGENVATGEVCEAVGSFNEIAEANVFGVSVPRAEGRAGMASIILKNETPLDLDGFHQHLIKTLPNYARPLFLCVKQAGSEEHEKTSTFKFKKTESQQKGFDPSLCAPHAVYFRDDAVGKFVPLDLPLYDSICNGSVRL